MAGHEDLQGDGYRLTHRGLPRRAFWRLLLGSICHVSSVYVLCPLPTPHQLYIEFSAYPWGLPP